MPYKRKAKAMNPWTPERVRALRAAYDESQADFCLRVGVGVDAYRLWEQGRGNPSKAAQIIMASLEKVAPKKNGADHREPEPQPA